MTRRRPRIEILESRQLFASDWQNIDLKCDVDRSDMVTSLDALIVINQLNAAGAHEMPSRPAEPDEPLSDVNGDHWLSALDALLIINALNAFSNRPPVVVGGLSPASDPNNNGVVLDDHVTVSGQTLGSSVITVFVDGVDESVASTLSDASGRFGLDLSVAEGMQTFRVTARDELGRRSEMKLDVRRGNVIQDWNAAVLDVVRQWSTLSNDPYPGRIVTALPPMVARNLAMIHVAMFDAANAVTGDYAGYRVHVAPQPEASSSVAAAAAAYEVAKALYGAPDELNVWQASLDEALAQVSDESARSHGLELGRFVGQAILADRAGDTNVTSTYQPTGEVGHWNRTYPDYLPPSLPQWPRVKPFVLNSADEMRPAPPPALDSSEYAEAVDQVMRLGSFNSTERTAEQTEIALFWADGPGTYTPAGHWNAIATEVTLMQKTDLLETARTFALMNVAMADAGIAAWDAKYFYDVWRPIDAIVKAELDGNPATHSDSTWMPLLKTPPFPSFTSGHSTFSSAASTILAYLFGDQFAFDDRTDGHNAPEQRPLDSSLLVTRHYTSFSQAADESGMSRIYGGIHFLFDDIAGLELGRRIATATIERVMARNQP